MPPREPSFLSWALSGASDEEAEPPNGGLTGLDGRGTSSSPAVLAVYCPEPFPQQVSSFARVQG